MRRSAVVNWSRGWVRRSWRHGAGALVLVGVGVGATAFACANLATPSLGAGEGAAVATQVSVPRPTGAEPNAQPVLVAETGTPAWAHVELLAAGGASPARVGAPSAEEAGVGGDPLDPSIWFSLIAVLGALAIMLLGSGLVAYLYQARQARLPAEARWVPPGW